MKQRLSLCAVTRDRWRRLQPNLVTGRHVPVHCLSIRLANERQHIDRAETNNAVPAARDHLTSRPSLALPGMVFYQLVAASRSQLHYSGQDGIAYQGLSIVVHWSVNGSSLPPAETRSTAKAALPCLRRFIDSARAAQLTCR
ncbi:hypothetical protein ZWY2020_008981 [Hordeum vulgare]|nr:hypothetical protein ZWY2020_008981 [Hordeum vulgare]